LTYRNARNLHETIAFLPLDRVLLESEAPFMVPAEYRNKRNMPEYLPSTARLIAEFLNIDLEEVAETTYQMRAVSFALNHNLGPFFLRQWLAIPISLFAQSARKREPRCAIPRWSALRPLSEVIKNKASA